MDSQAKQISIRDLLVTGKPSVSMSKRLRQTNIVCPELMVGCFRFAVSNSIALCGVNASKENAGLEIARTNAHSVNGHVAQTL